jgi:hypothetical protein
MQATIEKPVSKQRNGKHTTIGVLLETVFSVEAVTRLHNKDLRQLRIDSRVEAGSNTSTVALQVIEGDEKRIKYMRV